MMDKDLSVAYDVFDDTTEAYFADGTPVPTDDQEPPADTQIAEDATQLWVNEKKRKEAAWATSAPVFDRQKLPGVIGRIVREYDRYTEADPMAVFITILAQIGALLSYVGGPYMNVNNRPMRPNLYVLLLGDSGVGRKGSSYENAEQLMEMTPISTITQDGVDSGEGLISLLSHADDKTHEELQNTKQVFLHFDEFANFMGKGRAESSTLHNHFRTAWSGKPIKNKTRDKSIEARDYSLSCVGHATYREIRNLLGENDIFGGSLNRFIIVHSHRSKKLPNGETLSGDLLVAMQTEIHKAIRRAQKLVTDLDGQSITRDDEAARLWAKIYCDDSLDEETEEVRAATERRLSYEGKMQMLFALLDGRTKINVQDVQHAHMIANYALETTRFLFNPVEVESLNEKQRKILDDLRNAGEQGLTQTEINRSVFGGNASAVAIKAHLDPLIKSGKVTKQTVPTKGAPKHIFRATV